MTTLAPEYLTAVGGLTYDRPVPRALVHKTGPGEAFVTDYAPVGEDRFLVAAELPRSHAFYGDSASVTPGVDVMTLLEIGRQSGYVALHQHFGIALENTSVMRSMGASLAPGADRLVVGGPARVVMDMHLARPFHRDGVLVGFRGNGVVTTADGEPVGDAWASFSWVTHDLFRAFRRATREQLGLPAAPPPPAWTSSPRPERAYGRVSPRNAMLAEPAHDGPVTTAWLRPDLEYVSVFDHAYDHVPGMAQTEGGKQLAVLAGAHRLGLRPDQVVARRLKSKFASINEVDFETLCTATCTQNLDEVRVHVAVAQAGRALGELDVLVVPR